MRGLPGEGGAVPGEELAAVLGLEGVDDLEQLGDRALGGEEFFGGHVALKGLGELGVGGTGVEQNQNCFGGFAAIFDRGSTDEHI